MGGWESEYVLIGRPVKQFGEAHSCRALPDLPRERELVVVGGAVLSATHPPDHHHHVSFTVTHTHTQTHNRIEARRKKRGTQP